MQGALIIGMEQRINLIETKLSDVDARASEEADCATNERDLDRFIYSGELLSSKVSRCCLIQPNLLK